MPTDDEIMERVLHLSEMAAGLQRDVGISQAFEERLTETKHYGRWNRFLIFLTMASLLFDLGITGYLISANHRINRNTKIALAASSDAAKLKQSDRIRCESGNEFRTADRARWNYIISLSPPPATPEAAARLKKFEGFIDAADRLRPCTTG